MGLLDNTTNQEYYQGNDLGNYQFTSLDNIISQFEVAYVGENKIIPKIKRADIAFHAMRALQELSFDTFKSVKSQQIDLPPTLVMSLPHDYVNYTKLSWTDSAGIKHPLYPTNSTSNPFQIKQTDGGYDYDFSFVTSEIGILENSDFSTDLSPAWNTVSPSSNLVNFYTGGIAIEDDKLKTSFHSRHGSGAYNSGFVHVAYQAIDVSDTEYLDISALGIADTIVLSASPITNTAPNPGVLRFGISSSIPDSNYVNNVNNGNSATAAARRSNNINASIFDLTTYEGGASYVEWIGPVAVGSTTSTEELINIDVSNNNVVYAVVVSYLNMAIPLAATPTRGLQVAVKANSIDDLVVTRTESSKSLIPKVGNERNSSTWNSYKGNTPSENNNDDYEDDTYWPANGERYGLDPQHAQANGSFYIDNRLGRIHFSSNISGKTVILDYISDSLGTDAEMQVHKFAEDAMYKYIAHAILSTSSYGQQLVRRLTKEKFAATRKAKLRLSNIKIEELTQVLRGKSKHIKH
tara:strand:- start:1759 stop:3321 length:1563 start_codon:yes stop_codon:yes gene_type:complete